MNRSARTGAALTGVAGIVALAGCGAVTVGAADSDEPTAPGASDGAYADGTYSATGAYTTPGGGESVEVTLTLEDGIVTAVDVAGSASGGDSARYQGEFVDGIADEVVGVAIDDLDVDRVGGSSLTSGGFHRAVEAILADASA